MLPAVDPLFRSAAEAYGRRVMGRLLTGGGDDGVRRLIDKAAADTSVIQNPDEAKVFSMPMSTLLYDRVDLVLSLQAIPIGCRGFRQGESVHRFSTPRDVHRSLPPNHPAEFSDVIQHG
jgi:hypothetical protein